MPMLACPAVLPNVPREASWSKFDSQAQIDGCAQTHIRLGQTEILGEPAHSEMLD